MARGVAAQVAQEALTPDETAQMDEMRRADTAPVEETPVEQAEDTAPVEQVAEKPPAGFVPHGALNEERERRRQTETRLAEIERQNTLLQERTNLILQSVAQQRQPEQQVMEPPALEKDPVGYLVGTLQRQGDVIQQLMQAEQQRNQQAQQTGGMLTLQQTAQAKEREYMQQNPDYEGALQHLMNARHAELTEVGVTDPLQRQQILSNEYLTVADLALKQGRNPAEVIYNLSKGRGYKANGAAAQEVVPPQDATARVANIAAGQQQARSLSSARGSAPVPLTAQRLLEMSNEDFAKTIATPEGKALLG